MSNLREKEDTVAAAAAGLLNVQTNVKDISATLREKSNIVMV